MQKFRLYAEAQERCRHLRREFDNVYGDRLREAYELMERISTQRPTGRICDYSRWEYQGKTNEGGWWIILYGQEDFDGEYPEHSINASQVITTWPTWKAEQVTRLEAIAKAKSRQLRLEEQLKTNTEYGLYKKLHKKYGEVF